MNCVGVSAMKEGHRAWLISDGSGKRSRASVGAMLLELNEACSSEAKKPPSIAYVYDRYLREVRTGNTCMKPGPRVAALASHTRVNSSIKRDVKRKAPPRPGASKAHAIQPTVILRRQGNLASYPFSEGPLPDGGWPLSLEERQAKRGLQS